MFQALPETENRTLEEIELHFSDNKRKITDRHIKKINQTTFENGVSDVNSPNGTNESKKY